MVSEVFGWKLILILILVSFKRLITQVKLIPIQCEVNTYNSPAPLLTTHIYRPLTLIFIGHTITFYGATSIMKCLNTDPGSLESLQFAFKSAAFHNNWKRFEDYSRKYVTYLSILVTYNSLVEFWCSGNLLVPLATLLVISVLFS